MRGLGRRPAAAAAPALPTERPVPAPFPRPDTALPPGAAARWPGRPWRAACGGWVALAMGLASALLPAWADTADRAKPLNVEADAGRYDDARRIGSFTGNVVVTRGSLVLRAAQVEVRQGPQGQPSAVATGTPGTPARFRQQREGLDETVEGEAQRIEFDGPSDTLRFIDGAVLRRYRGGKLADEASGALITFDNTASAFSVSGNAPGATGGGRVRATIGPREAAPAPASPPAPSPAAPAPVR